ncbi:hypothetical protein A1O7_00753 [Cladophialophora yegresii CBS 114405]|uniref:Uncharacterized protein n=1 Tax=Cladophialophora yegresii CBS 114405 TaxID=1182544 RepID=W9W8J5_9EURO|nr:uncharacterized protein A1O7_00753 [Cladophialophora yegresii CBS 114405]EXJ64417.1 hypothetical protein A1O7_00753 [Cladophialophora yegresii CBS 114405]
MPPEAQQHRYHHSLSPIKKVKAALEGVKSPKSPPSSPSSGGGLPEDHQRITVFDFNCDTRTRIEEIYFDDPKSRECLSVNPGDHPQHEQERKRCTAENWRAEIERRIVAQSKMVDHAYGDAHPFRAQAYGHGDGQK